jgi:hypothetical protein
MESTIIRTSAKSSFAEKLNLTALTPLDDLATTSYCLASPGSEYLIYQPKAGKAFSVK